MNAIIGSLISLLLLMNTTEIDLHMRIESNVSPADIEELRIAMPNIAELFIKRRNIRRQERMAEYVEFLVKDVPMRSIDKRVSDLQAKALERIYKGTEWLTAAEIGKLGDHGKANLSAAAHRWKEQGMIFALRRSNCFMYPRYEFADDYKPLPVIREILSEFDGASAVRIASWFESTSSFLNGRRPREIVASNPDLVVQAAKDAIQAELEPA